MCHAKQHNNDNKMLDINMISYGWIQQKNQSRILVSIGLNRLRKMCILYLCSSGLPDVMKYEILT